MTTQLQNRIQAEPSQISHDAAAFGRIGAITRELHEALRSLGAAPALQRVVQEIPDARDRLSHVGDLTERAAHRVLGLVEVAKPACDLEARQNLQMAEALDQAARDDTLNAAPARQLFARCAEQLRCTAAFAERQSETLSDIMMTQDFQDLSGQVIKRVIDMITRTESQLVHLLLDYPQGAEACPEMHIVEPEGLAGPQTPDKALQQDDVDDLLASMGF